MALQPDGMLTYYEQTETATAQVPVQETGPTLPTSLLALQVPIQFPVVLLPQQQLVLHGTLFRKVALTGMLTETRHPAAAVVQLLVEVAMADGLMESTFQDLSTYV